MLRRATPALLVAPLLLGLPRLLGLRLALLFILRLDLGLGLALLATLAAPATAAAAAATAATASLVFAPLAVGALQRGLGCGGFGAGVIALLVLVFSRAFDRDGRGLGGLERL